MNTGAFGENFPYSNFHDLNMDWIVKIAKDFLDQYTHIQDTINQGLEDLESKKEELEGLLQQWYDTHSEDIANQLASALEELRTQSNIQLQQVLNSIEIKYQQTMASIPSDYSALANQVSNLAQDIANLPVNDIINRFNIATITPASWINPATGGVNSGADFFLSDYIYVGDLSTVNICYVHNYCWFTEDKAYISGSGDGSISADKTLTPPSNAKYFRFSSYNTYLYLAQVGYGVTRDNYVNYGIYTLPQLRIEPYQMADPAEFEVMNLFNPNTMVTGKYISVVDGTLTTGANFFASDFIYVENMETIRVSRTHIIALYDINKQFTGTPESYDSINNDLVITIPHNVAYLRFSSYNDYQTTAQVGKNVTRSNYVPYGIFKVPNLRISGEQITDQYRSEIIVDAHGGGDYMSFTDALYSTVDDGTPVKVMPGTYDIKQEYIAKFGSSAVANMSDASSDTFHGFQFGVIIRNRKVEFLPGAKLVCDWTGYTINGTHRFCPVRVDYNAEIIGMNLDSTNTFYAIHDDYGVNTPYTNTYRNCRIEGHNLYNANCIGGGCKKYSRTIIDNCYFDNHVTTAPTVRYHNTDSAGAEPEVYVSNTYFNNWFTPRWYGGQDTKMKVYVNNCFARAIYKMAESSSYNVDNIELIKWCNTETNPM